MVFREGGWRQTHFTNIMGRDETKAYKEGDNFREYFRLITFSASFKVFVFLNFIFYSLLGDSFHHIMPSQRQIMVKGKWHGLHSESFA